PKASKPIVCSTLWWVMRLNRAYTSVPMNPSGWPTCRPEPEGYGNMSSTNSFSPRAAASSGSPSSPVGLGVSKVWLAAHQSCQRSSISCASAAVYRNGGVSVLVSGACSLVLIPGNQPTAGGSWCQVGIRLRSPDRQRDDQCDRRQQHALAGQQDRDESV